MQRVREVCLEGGVMGTQRLALGGGREEGVGEGKMQLFIGVVVHAQEDTLPVGQWKCVVS